MTFVSNRNLPSLGSPITRKLHHRKLIAHAIWHTTADTDRSPKALKLSRIFALFRKIFAVTILATRTITGLYRPSCLRRIPIFSADTIGVQNIAQCHDTFQLMHIGAAHDRQYLQMINSHPLQSKIETLIDMNMRKIART
jgi:hypothetical protein